MSKVVVRQPHGLSTTDAQKRMDSFQEMMGKYGVSANWSGSKATLKGIGVGGSIEIHEKEVVVTVTLGMMAKAIGVDPVRLQASIEKRLRAAFEK